MAKGPPTLARVSVGTSGWSYPSWRPGFYPAGTDPSAFLAYYAERFPTVELNTTGYRIPGREQFSRWAEQAVSHQTPDRWGARDRAMEKDADPRRSQAPGRFVDCVRMV